MRASYGWLSSEPTPNAHAVLAVWLAELGRQIALFATNDRIDRPRKTNGSSTSAHGLLSNSGESNVCEGHCQIHRVAREAVRPALHDRRCRPARRQDRRVGFPEAVDTR